MAQPGIEHSNNPSFRCSQADLLRAVGRRSAPPAIVEARDGLEADGLLFCIDGVTLPSAPDRSHRGLAVDRGLAVAVRALAA